MKTKSCPFQDLVLSQGANSAQNEQNETDWRTRPDWLRMCGALWASSASFLQVPRRAGDEAAASLDGAGEKVSVLTDDL